MKFNTLKDNVYRALEKQKFNGSDTVIKINKIIVGVVLFSTVDRIVELNSNYKNSSSELVDSYIETIKGTVVGLNERYTTYKEIKNYIERKNISNFFNIKRTEISDILTLYNSRKNIPEFSTFSYTALMYGIDRIFDHQNERLRKIHYNIICPIIKFYMNCENITEGDVTISDVSADNNPGKEIKLAISGIQNGRIINDINSKKINISDFIYSLNITSDNFVKLVIN